MKRDIESREDIKLLVQTFYRKVTSDLVIGHIFTNVMKVDWEKHLPVMYDFWESVLFSSRSYSGNPITAHQKVNEIYPLSEEHFKQWLSIFFETVDELFEGEKAELAKQRAISIATIMKIKIFHHQ